MNDVNPQPVDAAIVPRFGAIPTFMRLPYRPDPAGLDIGLIGVPWDGGTTNRAGARHGPREIRNMSSFMRKVHHVSRIAPYKLAKVADLGDAPGTGTPEIGGLTTLEAQHLIRGLEGLNLSGGDVVEVSPPFDPSGNTALVGATMMFEILCVLAKAVAERRKPT